MAKLPRFTEEFAEAIVDAIENGRAPWQKVWVPGEILQPLNPHSGTKYRGANVIQLVMSGYNDPRWMTFKHAQEAGYKVQRGSKSTKISFFSTHQMQDVLDEEGRPVLGSDGKPEKEAVHRPFLRVASVFNGTQLDGIEPYVPEPPAWNPVERAETLLTNSGASIRHSQRDRAFYSSSHDRIELPAKSQFPSAEAYYSTAIHELAHWTAKEGRVERKTGAKGTEEYAREELRAEIASWMINTELGLGHNPENHVNYTAGWAKAIKDDPKEIFRAASDAERIKEFIMGLEHVQERTQQNVLQKEDKRLPERSQDKAESIVWLSVPFREKEAAKKHGAKWDKEKRSWYAPTGTDLTQLDRWVPKQAARPAMPVPPQEEFAQALKEAGLDLRGQPPEMDGKLHRVPLLDGNQGKKDGAYVGYLNGRPAGFIENHKTGEKTNWKYTGHELSTEEKAHLKAAAAARKAAKDTEQERGYARAAHQAGYIWDKTVAVQNHSYLEKKGIQAHGVRITDRGDLAVPARDLTGNIHTLQFISPDGSKRFLSGGRKSGHFHIIGKPDRKDPLLLAEGYATAASIHQATRFPCIVCFDASNLQPVAKALRAQYPDKEIVICADNDHTREDNVGLEKARKAAEAVGGHVIEPKLRGDEKAKGLTDFNDLAMSRGARGFKQQFTAALDKVLGRETGQGRELEI